MSEVKKLKITDRVEKKSGEKDGRKWTIRKYTAIDPDGVVTTFESFDDIPDGEQEIELTPNPPYADSGKWKNKPRKGGGGPKIDYDFEARRTALECAVRLVAAGKYEPKQLGSVREKFYVYLKN